MTLIERLSAMGLAGATLELAVAGCSDADLRVPGVLSAYIHRMLN